VVIKIQKHFVGAFVDDRIVRRGLSVEARIESLVLQGNGREALGLHGVIKHRGLRQNAEKSVIGNEVSKGASCRQDSLSSQIDGKVDLKIEP